MTPAAQDARIRIYDVVAHGGSDTGLELASGRHLDLPVAELARLLAMLGSDGLQAFCLYLEHLEQVPGMDGQLTLGVPHFSARWLHAASLEAADRYGSSALSKNAATRGHQAVDRSGLLHALANPTGLAGQGARGRTWRAVLNPRLVILQGGQDVDENGPRPLRGRPKKGSEAPLSRNAGSREPGPGPARSGGPGKPVVGPLPGESGKRQSGPPPAVKSLVSAACPGAGPEDTSTSSVSVVSELLSTSTSPGLIAQQLLPATRDSLDSVLTRLRPLFNDAPVADRSADVVQALDLPAEETRRPDVLAVLLTDIVLGHRNPTDDLRRLGVSGPPVLSPAELRDRLIVGLLIGLGLRRISSWGAWLYQATRPDWTPKPGPLVDRFAQIVLASTPSPTASGTAPPASAPPRPRLTVAPTSRPTEAAPGDVEPPLAAAVVEQHFAAARSKWPMLCRPGTPQADDPQWRTRLVRMYLAAEERAAQLDPTQPDQVLNQ